MKTVFNSEVYNFLEEPLFLGKPLGLQRFDKFKYPIFWELYKKQIEFFWWPHELENLGASKNDYKNLSDAERFLFDENLSFQTAGDSTLSRSITSLKDLVSNTELEACMLVWAHMENIHSYSYTYLLENVYPDAGKFFDNILKKPEIVSRVDLIKNSYDQILGEEGKEKDIRDKIYNCVLATNVMEGLVFYISFACSYFFGEQGKMRAASDMIKLINRDEFQHLAITTNIYKIFESNKKEGFQDIVKNNRDKAVELFRKTVENEKTWIDYLFSKGSVLGLNEKIMHGYIEHLAGSRMETLGLPKIYDVKNPIGGWLSNWSSNKNVQSANQETQNLSYKVKSSKNDMNDMDLGSL